MPRPLFARGPKGSGDASSDNAYEASDTGSLGGYSNSAAPNTNEGGPGGPGGGTTNTPGLRSSSPAMSSLSAAAGEFSGPSGPPGPSSEGPRLFRYLGGPSDQPQQQYPSGLNRHLSGGPPPGHQSGPPPQSQLGGHQQQPQQGRPGLQQFPGGLAPPPHLQHLLPPAPAPPPHLQQSQQQPRGLNDQGYSPNGQQPPEQHQGSAVGPTGYGISGVHGGTGPGPGSQQDSEPRNPDVGIVGISSAMDPLENILGPFPCARLRGIPYDVNLEDVMAFFQGLVILDVVVLNPSQHPKGQGKGEAFVIFSNPMDFQMALQRDKALLMGNQIEIFHGKRNDYYAAIATEQGVGSGPSQLGGSSMPHMGGTGGMMSNSSLNSAYGSSSLQQQAPGGMAGMGGMPPIENLSLGTGMGGLGGNDAMGGYVGHPGVHGGVHGVHGVMPGGAMRPSQTRPTSRGGGIREGEHTGFLRMRGLPFSATRQEILEFFQDFEPLEDSVCLTCRSDGRATGEAYVAFNSPDDAKKAMSLHRSTMGTRYIELFISNKDEHARAMARTNNR